MIMHFEHRQCSFEKLLSSMLIPNYHILLLWSIKNIFPLKEVVVTFIVQWNVPYKALKFHNNR